MDGEIGTGARPRFPGRSASPRRRRHLMARFALPGEACAELSVVSVARAAELTVIAGEDRELVLQARGQAEAGEQVVIALASRRYREGKARIAGERGDGVAAVVLELVLVAEAQLGGHQGAAA